jgi:transposase-like protein
MDRRIREFRKILRREQRSQPGRRRRYSQELRSEAVELVRELRSAGRSHLAAAKELGLNPITLSIWQKKSESRPGGETGALKPVALVEGPVGESSSEVVVVGPHGVRVEGLDLDGVAALLRKLA